MSATENYRIENKGNVTVSGKSKRTSFQIFKRDGDRFLFVGNYFASGWNRTDKQCIAFYLKRQDDHV